MELLSSIHGLPYIRMITVYSPHFEYIPFDYVLYGCGVPCCISVHHCIVLGWRVRKLVAKVPQGAARARHSRCRPMRHLEGAQCCGLGV